MKIAIYGAGSLGTILGAFITKGGMDIDLINRNTSHIAGLKGKGAQIIGSIRMTVPVKAFLPEEMKDKYDLIFLMTKQMDNTNVIKQLEKHLTGDGVICTMQNGLPELSVAEIIGEDKTFGCAVLWGATMIGNGVCELTSAPEKLTFNLGSLSPNKQAKLEEIKRVLELMGPVEIEENFLGSRWSKLLVNCSFSGMSAVLGATFGEVAKNKKSRLCVQRIIKECIDTAKKADIKIEPIQGKDICKLLDYNNKLKQKISFAIIPFAIRKHRFTKASMLQDLEKGRRCEIDSINGVVCKYGDKYDVPTPFNDLVVEIIHGIEDSKYPPRFDNLRFFENLF
jgi:2-dehydropantoate 2-reductase